MRRRSMVLFMALLASGCSTLDGGVVAARTDAVSKVAGVPYYLTTPAFRIDQKTLHSGKKAQVVNEIVVTAKADPSRRFEVGLEPGWFSSDNFSLSIAAGGNVTALSSKTTDETGRVIGEFAKLAAAVAKLALSAPSLKKVISDAEKEHLIASADATAAEAAIDALTAVIDETPKPSLAKALPKSELEAWGKVYKELRTAFIKGKDRSPAQGGRFEGLGELIEARDCIAPLIMPPGPGDKVAAEENTGIPICPQPEDIANAKKVISTVVVVVNAEDAIIRLYDELTKLDDFQDKIDAHKPGTVSSVLAALRKKYEAALAIAVDNPTKANKQAATKAAGKIKDAVELVLDADHELSGRALKKRRDVLVSFLDSKIDTSSRGNVWQSYEEFSKSLDAVLGAITTAVGETAPKKSETLPRATEVTTRIEDVYVDQHSAYLGQSDRKNRLKLAGARIKAGTADAVVIASPQKGGK